jgi:hypothetical protein
MEVDVVLERALQLAPVQQIMNATKKLAHTASFQALDITD